MLGSQGVERGDRIAARECGEGIMAVRVFCKTREWMFRKEWQVEDISLFNGAKEEERATVEQYVSV